MSRPFAKPLVVEIGPSIGLGAGLTGAWLGAFSCLAGYLPWHWLAIAAGLGSGVWCWRAVNRYALQRAPDSAVAISCSTDGRWATRNRSGEAVEFNPLTGAHVGTLMLIVHGRHNGIHRAVLIPRDAVTPAAFRRLRARLNG